MSARRAADSGAPAHCFGPPDGGADLSADGRRWASRPDGRRWSSRPDGRRRSSRPDGRRWSCRSAWALSCGRWASSRTDAPEPPGALPESGADGAGPFVLGGREPTGCQRPLISVPTNSR
ncbi:hypothetical protein STRAU_0484 [Streptomyces aurantiacus JA 4570]|uniref:Uncharacterized protein n=1 Tax=Streptomyces aurantiacus JA 4570 TaxID=1286094 RepID=S4AYT7_9ACTN|nr:hypothetical protein STRAU_0484 [Streptomyces aurantiacus JA 4570]